MQIRFWNSRMLICHYWTMPSKNNFPFRCFLAHSFSSSLSYYVMRNDLGSESFHLDSTERTGRAVLSDDCLCDRFLYYLPTNVDPDPRKHSLNPKSFRLGLPKEKREKRQGLPKSDLSSSHYPKSRQVNQQTLGISDTKFADGREPSLGKENETPQESKIPFLFLGLGVNCKLDSVSDNVILVYT